MVDKSINLCGISGDEAAWCLFDKLRDPSTPLRLGSTALRRVKVSHFHDGLPVITAEIDDEHTLIFQFALGPEPFSETAMDQDGARLCPPDAEL